MLLKVCALVEIAPKNPISVQNYARTDRTEELVLIVEDRETVDVDPLIKYRLQLRDYSGLSGEASYLTAACSRKI